MARKKLSCLVPFHDGELEELAEELSNPFTFRRNGNEYHTSQMCQSSNNSKTKL